MVGVGTAACIIKPATNVNNSLNIHYGIHRIIYTCSHCFPCAIVKYCNMIGIKIPSCADKVPPYIKPTIVK